MSPLWTGDEFLAATGGRVIGAMPSVISGISIDSRTIMPGEAFFAITGDRMDGHDYVNAALDNHASIVVIEEAKAHRFNRVWPVLVVDDVLEALNRLAIAARARSQAKIVAVTGSVGKTSTKEMLRLALTAHGPVHASPASFNNHWGVPLTLARLPQNAAYGVFEIGMNHAGEITPLVQMVRPHIAVITNVEAVHLEHFASVEAIADAKAEILTGIEPGGFAVLNADNPHFPRLANAAQQAGAQIRTFGLSAGADARSLIHSVLTERTAVTANILGKDIAYRLGAPGSHFVLNSLAVLLTARLLDVDLGMAAAVLADFQPPAGRGQRHVLHVNGQRALLLDESYNANPASMRAAIELLGHTNLGRRVAVLGDMLELGDSAEELHRALASALEKAKIDVVFCAGSAMRALFEVLPEHKRGLWAQTSEELQQAVQNAVRPGDVIMVKGSNSSNMGAIVSSLTTRFAAETAA